MHLISSSVFVVVVVAIVVSANLNILFVVLERKASSSRELLLRESCRQESIVRERVVIKDFGLRDQESDGWMDGWICGYRRQDACYYTYIYTYP